jgi:hypothetical protein
VNTRAITTSTAVSSCDICGRTLLRGERAETYLDGAERRSVCELCTSRALQGGWIREGTLPDYGPNGARVERRRSFLSRLRSRREVPAPAPEPEANDPWAELDEPAEPPPPRRQAPPPRPAAPPPVRADAGAPREPRHVRAVPTSTEHKISTAIGLFNDSEHPRTVAGISRSLGIPEASILPSSTQPSVVHVLVAWELCWYRYELDLSDEVPAVRLATQGYELDEIEAEERLGNAVADDRGCLSLPD